MIGACHCGAVRFEVSRPPHEVTDCNCSLCAKRGGLWAYYNPDEFKLLAAEGQRTYRWNTKLVAISAASAVVPPTTTGPTGMWSRWTSRGAGWA